MIKRLLAGLLLLSVCLLANPLPVHAKDILTPGITCTSGSSVGGSAVCTDDNNTNKQDNPVVTKLTQATNIIAYVAGAAAVIVVIVGAIRLITSGSDISNNASTDHDVRNARNTITGALIGLAIIVLTRTLIVYVVNKLL